MTPRKREAILKFYENAALGMYNGLAKRMAGYANSQQTGRETPGRRVLVPPE